MTAHDEALVEKAAQALCSVADYHATRASDFPCWCSVDEAIAVLDAVADDLRAQGAAKALRDAAALIYNGAPDPCQALYNYGGNPWLNELADRVEAGEQL